MTRIGVAVLAAVALAGCGEQQESRAHPHEEQHGQPMTAPALERNLLGMAFVDQSEDKVHVSKAECVPGEPDKRRDIHHVCVLRFGSGGLVAEQVAVHVVTDGWIFYSDVVVPAIE